jgi:hypothetical protein
MKEMYVTIEYVGVYVKFSNILTLSNPRGFSRSTLGNPEGFYFIFVV